MSDAVVEAKLSIEIVDRMMPGRNGIELALAIKADPAAAGGAALIAERHVAGEVHRAEADIEYMSKPPAGDLRRAGLEAWGRPCTSRAHPSGSAAEIGPVGCRRGQHRQQDRSQGHLNTDCEVAVAGKATKPGRNRSRSVRSI